MKKNKILEIDGVYYTLVDGSSCSDCALKEKCESSLFGGDCSKDTHFEKADIEPTKEMIRRVLRLSHEAEKVFNEGCRFIIGVTIDEQLDNQRRQRTGLLLEERIRFIKDHWKDFYYLHPIRSREGLTTVKI